MPDDTPTPRVVLTPGRFRENKRIIMDRIAGAVTVLEHRLPDFQRATLVPQSMIDEMRDMIASFKAALSRISAMESPSEYPAMVAIYTEAARRAVAFGGGLLNATAAMMIQPSFSWSRDFGRMLGVAAREIGEMIGNLAAGVVEGSGIGGIATLALVAGGLYLLSQDTPRQVER